MTKPEEMRYPVLMGRLAVTKEDKAVKQEASRQYRALMKEWRAKAAIQKVPAFEVLRVVSDRSPFSDGFDYTRHLTVYYKLDGVEHHDAPISLDHMLRRSPGKFPPIAAEVVRNAVRDKLGSLMEQCKGAETAKSESSSETRLGTEHEPTEATTTVPETFLGIEIDDSVKEHRETRSIDVDRKGAVNNNDPQSPAPTENPLDPPITSIPPGAEEASTNKTERPHPDSLEGALERLEFTHRCNEEDKKVVASSTHTFGLLETRQDDAGELLVTAEIDGERKEWRYDDLEAEVGDHADQYPPFILDQLQERKKQALEPRDARVREQGKPNTPALRLVEMAKQDGRAEYFHDLARIPYARIDRYGHYEVRAVREAEFAEWLTELNYDAEGLAPEEATSRRAIATLSFLASRGEERQIYLRHGEHDGAFYYDLCNDQWQAVRITPDGWDVVDNPPVMFRRYDHMRPQVIPLRPNGEHWALKALVGLANIGKVGREVLEVQLHVLMIPGIEQMGGGTLGMEGTGKTTTQRLAVAVGDPSTDVECSLPKKKNDLTLHLSTHSLASFDNLTHISEDQSDDLSRSNTGATDTQRELYTNNGTNRRRYQTPSFFNGINITGAKPDFYDRNIIYRTFETFDGPRLSKRKMAARIEELLPHALGEIFDNLSTAMRYRAEFSEEGRWTPRMVDWYLWALAIAKAMGRPDDWFEKVFKPMIEHRDYDAIADQPLTRALEYIADQRGYVGTAAELYAHLIDKDQDIPFKCQIDTRDKNWPTSAVSFGVRIKPLLKALRSHGVYIYKRQWTNLKRYEKALYGLERARMFSGGNYRDSDDLYVVSASELELGRDDGIESSTGGK